VIDFFRQISRRIGKFVRRAVPVLRSVARVSAPVIGAAVLVLLTPESVHTSSEELSKNKTEEDNPEG
jgi:hypothetical protein